MSVRDTPLAAAQSRTFTGREGAPANSGVDGDDRPHWPPPTGVAGHVDVDETC